MKAACQSLLGQFSIITLPSVTSLTEGSALTASSRFFQAASASAGGRPLASQTMAVGKARAVEKFFTTLIRTFSDGVPFVPLRVLWMRLVN